MTCRAIEQMIKEVEEQTRLRNISTLHRTMGLSYEHLFDVLDIPQADRPRYLSILNGMEQKENNHEP